MNWEAIFIRTFMFAALAYTFIEHDKVIFTLGAERLVDIIFLDI